MIFAVIRIGHTLSSRAELHGSTLTLSYWPMTKQLSRPAVTRTGPPKSKLVFLGTVFGSGNYDGKQKGDFLEPFFKKFRMLLTTTWDGVSGGGTRG